MEGNGFMNLEDSYRTRKYIPSKYSNSLCLKVGAIAASLVIVTLIIAAIAGVFHSSNDVPNGKYNNETKNQTTMQLVLSGNNKLVYLDIEHKTINNTQYSINTDIGLFEVYGYNNFFWYSTNKSAIYHHLEYLAVSNTSDGYYGQLFQDKRVKVQDMAYDHIGENLYVIDKTTGTLIVIDLWTKSYDLLLSDLVRPHHIQVDPENGIMFILQQSNSILRLNMDGTSMEKVIQSDSLTSMTLDTRSQRIYWVDNAKGIESADYKGNDRKLYPIDISNVVDMAVVNDQIYWLWEEYGEDSSLHRLVSCKIQNGTCADHTVNDLDYLGEFGSIKATEIHPKWNSTRKHACSKENNTCQHLCLLSSDGKSSCTCKLGWQLDLDRKTCRQTKDMLVYALGNHFRGRILDSISNVSKDAILPTPYEVKPSSDISFDYDTTNDTLYFSDAEKIYSMQLKTNWNENSTQSQIYKVVSSDTTIKDIAYDWITRNLYYLEKNKSDGFKLQVFNVERSQFNKTLISQRYLDITSLEIYPQLGYLAYYTLTVLRNRGMLHITKSNGTEIVQVLNNDYSRPGRKPLSIDYTDRRIYWISDQFGILIRSCNFNGTDIKNITLHDVRPPIRSISVHRKWIYANTDHAVYRIDKNNSYEKIKLLQLSSDRTRNEINAVKIFSESTSAAEDSMKNPCYWKSNGCEQFCFLIDSKAVCDCRNGEILNDQGKCSPKS